MVEYKEHALFCRVTRTSPLYKYASDINHSGTISAGTYFVSHWVYTNDSKTLYHVSKIVSGDVSAEGFWCPANLIQYMDYEGEITERATIEYPTEEERTTQSTISRAKAMSLRAMGAGPTIRQSGGQSYSPLDAGAYSAMKDAGCSFILRTIAYGDGTPTTVDEMELKRLVWFLLRRL